MLDSLVRVSRRVGWLADSDATDHVHHTSVLVGSGTSVQPTVRAQQAIHQPQAGQAETRAGAVVYSTGKTEQVHQMGHCNREAAVDTQVTF
jgi:hypothetical protein